MARSVEMKPLPFVLKPDLRSMATVLNPQDAEQPILPESVRGAVHQWMTEIRAEDELKAVGVSPRRSALLSGPPGCGKTTLAHHLASRLGLALVCVHMDRIRSKWVGATGENIANLFEHLDGQAKNCILFLDEFDAIAAKRSNDEQASSRENNSIVDALLARIEMYEGMMVAATNRADAIDPAIWRRFGMQLEIPLPGLDERFAILSRYLHPYTLPDEAMDVLTVATEGAAPSLLRQVMEGIKRDLILSARLQYPDDVQSVFARVLAAVKPHKDYATPPLWEDPRVQHHCSTISWPPTKKEAA